MPLNLEFEFLVGHQPLIDVKLKDPATGLFDWAEALIDTGADLSVFDERIALRLALPLSDEITPLKGIGSGTILTRRSLIELQLLGEPDLAVTIPICFAPDMEDGPRNLIGLDVLQHVDIALSLASHIGYVGKAAGAAV